MTVTTQNIYDVTWWNFVNPNSSSILQYFSYGLLSLSFTSRRPKMRILSPFNRRKYWKKLNQSIKACNQNQKQSIDIFPTIQRVNKNRSSKVIEINDALVLDEKLIYHDYKFWLFQETSHPFQKLESIKRVRREKKSRRIETWDLWDWRLRLMRWAVCSRYVRSNWMCNLRYFWGVYWCSWEHSRCRVDLNEFHFILNLKRKRGESFLKWRGHGRTTDEPAKKNNRH